MIISLGTDLIEVARIRAALDPAGTLAHGGRWAAGTL